MTYKDKPYSNNYEKRIYEAKEAILKAELNENTKDWSHEVYPRIGTSDRQRAYLVKHGIKHVRKDGEYR